LAELGHCMGYYLKRLEPLSASLSRPPDTLSKACPHPGRERPGCPASLGTVTDFEPSADATLAQDTPLRRDFWSETKLTPFARDSGYFVIACGPGENGAMRESTHHWPATRRAFFIAVRAVPRTLEQQKSRPAGRAGNNHQRRRFATDTAVAPVSYPQWGRNHYSSTFRCLDMGFDIATPYL